MSNKEVFATIKKVNLIVDRIEGLSTNSVEYINGNNEIDYLLDSITFDCPRWKYYKAWELHRSNKSGHYWVTFA